MPVLSRRLQRRTGTLRCCTHVLPAIRGFPSMLTQLCVSAEPTAPSPLVDYESEKNPELQLRDRTTHADRNRPAKRSALLTPPSTRVVGRDYSHSSSRTRSLSVSPPRERHTRRVGRRSRALGEGTRGARARSFSPHPRSRRHRYMRAQKETGNRKLQPDVQLS